MDAPGKFKQQRNPLTDFGLTKERQHGLDRGQGMPRDAIFSIKVNSNFAVRPLILRTPPFLRPDLSRSQRFSLELATADDAAALAALHTAVAEDLTRIHGRGAWSTRTSEKGVHYAMRTSRVFVAREGGEIVATLRLATKKPWAIDTRYFSPCSRPLYLLAMAVSPPRQRHGLGRRCLEEATRSARESTAEAVRLDAFDAAAGAGGFYARCGWSEVGRTSYRNTRLIYYEFLL